MAENKENNFLVKIKSIRRRSYASSIFLKPDDIIVAINNQFFTFGEKKLTEELKEIKKDEKKVILTVLRSDTFFDIVINNSLGCKYSSTTVNETQSIREKFSSKENFDLEQLLEFTVLRDAFRRYDVIDTSVMAGLFPPLWLTYSQKWWVLAILVALSSMLLIVNPLLFLFGWLLMSLYCYKAQLNLMYSFSMLEGKVFCMNIAAKSLDHAQEIIRKIDSKSKFKYSKLPHPLNENLEKEAEKKQDIINEKKEALV